MNDPTLLVICEFSTDTSVMDCYCPEVSHFDYFLSCVHIWGRWIGIIYVFQCLRTNQNIWVRLSLYRHSLFMFSLNEIHKWTHNGNVFACSFVCKSSKITERFQIRSYIFRVMLVCLAWNLQPLLFSVLHFH